MSNQTYCNTYRKKRKLEELTEYVEEFQNLKKNIENRKENKNNVFFEDTDSKSASENEENVNFCNVEKKKFI